MNSLHYLAADYDCRNAFDTFLFLPSMGEMVKVATVVAFVAAPVLAILNTLAMFDKTVPQQYRPGKLMLFWCLLGLSALIGCSASYLILS